MSDFNKSKNRHVKTRAFARELRYWKKVRSRAVRRAKFGDEALAIRASKAGREIM